MEASLAHLRDRIVGAHAEHAPLRLRGAGTKDFYGERLDGDVLDTRAHVGIVSYDASELVLTARCGTRLSDIEATLAANDQYLPFEPPAFGGDPTIGGVVAAGLSGPRRASVGAVRDYVLGTRLLNAHGELLGFGGQVMKNVAGFDVSRLLCGSLGILGLIVEVSLKVMPRARAEVTRRFELSAPIAIRQFNDWGGKPFPISATAWHAGHAYVRLAGATSAVAAAAKALGGEAIAESDAEAWWNSLRHQTANMFHSGRPLWRLSVPSTAALESDVDAWSPADVAMIEWGGALRWLHSNASPEQIRRSASRLGGSAMQWNGPRAGSMFHPLSAANLDLHRRLKQQFDPHGIFNPGRLIGDL